MKKHYIAVGALVCILLGALSYRLMSPVASDGSEDLRAQYLEAGDFHLQGEKGPVALSDFKGRPVILYFGFTFCPDICPVGLTVIRDALNGSERFKPVQAIFISIDPERDTHERLSEYLEFFHPQLLGLRGEVDEVRAIAKRYGGYFVQGKADEQGQYNVDHTAYYYLIDANGKLVRVLDHDTSAETLVEELKKLI